MVLKQKDESELKIFKILDNGLKIVEESELGIFNRIVPFESISNEFIRLKIHPIQFLLIFIIFIAIIGAITIMIVTDLESNFHFVVSFTVFLFGGFWGIFKYRNKQFVLKCFDDKGLEFFKENPTKKEFDDFLNHLFNKRDLVLKEKYAFVTEFIPYKDQMEKFQLLHLLGVVSMEEYEELVRELDNLVNIEPDEFPFHLN